MGGRVLDIETGLIIDEVDHIVTKKQQYKIDEYKKKVKFQKYIYNKYGDFFFYKYNELLNDINYDMATAFRFLYVCSFCDKNGYVIAYEDYKCMEVADFIYVFDRPSSTVKDFCKKLIDYGLLYQDYTGCYRVNENYYSHKLTDEESKKYNIRTFNRSIQELYKKMSTKEHRLGGELMKLVPYINVYTNALCWNVYERDPKNIEVLTKTDIQNIIRKDSDYGRKLYNQINKFTLHDEVIISLFTGGVEEHYVMNPRIFYRGNDINDIKVLVQHFDIAKEQNKKRRMKRKNDY